MKPKFITFEGPDGSGKTTALKGLKKYLNKHYPNLDYIFTREPGGSITAESIRDVILNKNNSDMDYEVEALLYATARRQHLASTIWPALKNNKFVFCDRYIHSSLAYQGYARGLGINHIVQMNNLATNNTWPDITIYFDISIDEAESRINNTRATQIEKEISDLRQKLRNANKKLRDSKLEQLLSKTINSKKQAQIEKLANKEQQLLQQLLNLAKSKSCNDRLESETYIFRKKVHEGYQEVIKKYGNKIKVIDASKSKKEVLKQIIDIVKSYI